MCARSRTAPRDARPRPQRKPVARGRAKTERRAQHICERLGVRLRPPAGSRRLIDLRRRRITSAARRRFGDDHRRSIACALEREAGEGLRDGRQRDDDGGGTAGLLDGRGSPRSSGRNAAGAPFRRRADVFREGALRHVASDDELGSLAQRARARLSGEARDRLDQDFGAAGRGACRDEIDDALRPASRPRGCVSPEPRAAPPSSARRDGSRRRRRRCEYAPARPETAGRSGRR